MHIYSYSLVFGLLVLRAIAPPALRTEELPLSYDDISRGIAEQLGPASERVHSGPLEGGTAPAGGRPAHRRDFTRLSERTHDATSVHTARGTDVQSALEGQQSERRDLQDGTVQRNRLVRFFRPILRYAPRLSRMARRRRDTEIQVRQQFDAFLHTLTTSTRGMIGPLISLGNSGNTMEFRFNIFLHETLSMPRYSVTIPVPIDMIDNPSDFHYLRERLERIMRGVSGALRTNNEHNLQAEDSIAMAQRKREIKIQVRQQFDAFLHTLTTSTRSMISPLIYLGTSGNTMRFGYNIFLHETLSMPRYSVIIPVPIDIIDNPSDFHYFRERLEIIMQRALEALHLNKQHNLQAGDPIPYTKTLKYMPMPPGYEPETPGTDGIKTITLDQAIGILEASSTTVPESGPVDFDGIIKEQRVNTSRKKTQDKNYKDHITSHKSIHGDAGSSTRPTSSPQHLSEVLLGDPLNTRCAICKGKFCLPEKDSGNDWVFEIILKIDNCEHYFHPHCITGWIITENKNTCPLCRNQVIPSIVYES
ncbi:hypothetical protein KEM48_000701 [Puccinia striiformis f. sp. tritici PST-130]|nr:hypothetical protein KEM48_000701 [Puccinia striiformis f. sp. tritici PST-130]